MNSGRAETPFHQSVGVEPSVPIIALPEMGFQYGAHDAVREKDIAFDTRDEQVNQVARALP